MLSLHILKNRPFALLRICCGHVNQRRLVPRQYTVSDALSGVSLGCAMCGLCYAADGPDCKYLAEAAAGASQVGPVVGTGGLLGDSIYVHRFGSICILVYPLLWLFLCEFWALWSYTTFSPIGPSTRGKCKITCGKR